MKRIMQVIFIGFTFFILTNFVDASSAKVTITGDHVFTKEITLYVQVSNIVDFKGACDGVCSLTGVLYYNQDQLELVEIKPMSGFSAHVESLEGNTLLNLDSNSGVLSTSKLASLKFKVKTMNHFEKSEIGISNMEISNGTDTMELSDTKFIIIYQASGTAPIEQEDIDKIVGNNNSSGSTDNSGNNSGSTTVPEKSNNSNLKSIELSSGHIDLLKNSVNYEVNVDYSVESITISGETENENATVEGFGVKDLAVGVNDFNIVVTAENGNKTVYTIQITRLEKNASSSTPDNTNPDSDKKEPNQEEIKIPSKKNSTLIIIMSSLAGIIVISVVIMIVIVRRNRNYLK